MRWLVIVCALLVGAVAPARAWCEASCLAPTPQGESHCPSHDPANAAAQIAAPAANECPVLDSARPTPPARLDIKATLVQDYVPQSVVRTHVVPSFARPQSAGSVFERATPLRI